MSEMPIYEYECPNGHRYEVIDLTRRLAQEPAVCPQCAAPATRLFANSNWQVGDGRGKGESSVGRAIASMKRRGTL